MGGGSWTSKDWTSYSSSHISSKKSAKEIYTRSSISDEFNPHGIDVRESCDNTEHPNSTPIIIGLDVTGSMNRVIEAIAKKLGELATQILERKPVTDPQIMFNAIGDSTCDSAPLQVTQFESDIRIAKQLTDLYFEQGGGGNHFESYPLAWYFAANHTAIDSFDKHGRKGFIFTMGDDCFPQNLTKSEIKKIFGDVVESDIKVEDVLQQANRKYEIFHLLIEQGGSASSMDSDKWMELMGERAIKVKDYTMIPEIIVSILETMGGKSVDDVVKSWDGNTALVVKDAISGISQVNSANTLVEF